MMRSFIFASLLSLSVFALGYAPNSGIFNNITPTNGDDALIDPIQDENPDDPDDPTPDPDPDPTPDPDPDPTPDPDPDPTPVPTPEPAETLNIDIEASDLTVKVFDPNGGVYGSNGTNTYFYLKLNWEKVSLPAFGTAWLHYTIVGDKGTSFNSGTVLLKSGGCAAPDGIQNQTIVGQTLGKLPKDGETFTLSLRFEYSEMNFLGGDDRGCPPSTAELSVTYHESN
jgi:type V secretory pathway adhesin AidA